MAKKKLLCICVLVGAMACLAGCSDGSASTHNVSGTQSIAQVIQSEMDKEDAKAEEKNSDSSETFGTSTGSLDDILASGDYPMNDEDGTGDTDISIHRDMCRRSDIAGPVDCGNMQIGLRRIGQDRDSHLGALRIAVRGSCRSFRLLIIVVEIPGCSGNDRICGDI